MNNTADTADTATAAAMEDLEWLNTMPGFTKATLTSKLWANGATMFHLAGPNGEFLTGQHAEPSTAVAEHAGRRMKMLTLGFGA